MKISVLGELVVAGISFGIGPCLFFCGPVLLPYLLSRGVSKSAGLKSVLLFFAGRTFAYSLLGFYSVLLFDTALFQKYRFNKPAGAILLCLAAANFFKKSERICPFSKKNLYDEIGIFSAGLFIGLSPCIPMLGVLTYIVAKSESPAAGAVYGLSFGIGTFVSPLLIAGFAAGYFSDWTNSCGKVSGIIRTVSSIILFYFGIRLIL